MAAVTTGALQQVRRAWPVLLLAMLLSACGPEPKPPPPAPPAAPAKAMAAAVNEAQAARFLADHWARPLAPQGPLPAALAAQGISLAPRTCAGCHGAQFEDWSQSLHSRAMGPGLMGQLINMPAHAREEHQDCLRCHAPLAEQADSLVAALTKPARQAAGAAGSVGSVGDARPLHEQGLVCAACHVRKNEWHGPPRRDGSQFSADPGASPHGGWQANSAFESSQFCAACHQFPDDGYALNGKLLENTYREWQDSRYATQGIACQSCHMPERRHLWRGIHDPEMVKKGIDIRAEEVSTSNGQVAARLSVTNTGVGHYFPTYVTPKVVISAFQQDAAGLKLPATEQQFVIGRQVSADLGREIADTRIAPDGKATFDYHRPRHAGARALVWQAQVQPDAFYLDLYVGLLRDGLGGKSRRLITQARDEAAASPYLVFDQLQPLP